MIRRISFNSMPKYDANKEGAFSFVTRDVELVNRVRDEFGRVGGNLLLKIFHHPLYCGIQDYVWGRLLDEDYKKSNLLEAIKVQNLCAMKGFAPRVYDIFLANFPRYPNYLFVAMLTDDLGDNFQDNYEDKEAILFRINEYLAEIKCLPPFFDMATIASNLIDGKWIDFQGAETTNQYVEDLKDRLVTNAIWSGNHYQTVEELKLVGFRNSKERKENLKLNEINFEDKTVLDIGCSDGVFCNYAYSKLAKRVIGIDLPSVVEVSRELSNHLGNFNIDYIGIDYAKEDFSCDIESFDIVFYLSVYRYFGYTDIVHKRVKDLLIFEQNGDDSDEDVLNTLNHYFGDVKFVGLSNDYDGRKIYHCRKPIVIS